MARVQANFSAAPRVRWPAPLEPFARVPHRPTLLGWAFPGGAGSWCVAAGGALYAFDPRGKAASSPRLCDLDLREILSHQLVASDGIRWLPAYGGQEIPSPAPVAGCALRAADENHDGTALVGEVHGAPILTLAQPACAVGEYQFRLPTSATAVRFSSAGSAGSDEWGLVLAQEDGTFAHCLIGTPWSDQNLPVRERARLCRVQPFTVDRVRLLGPWAPAKFLARCDGEWERTFAAASGARLCVFSLPPGLSKGWLGKLVGARARPGPAWQRTLGAEIVGLRLAEREKRPLVVVATASGLEAFQLEDGSCVMRLQFPGLAGLAVGNDKDRVLVAHESGGLALLRTGALEPRKLGPPAEAGPGAWQDAPGRFELLVPRAGGDDPGDRAEEERGPAPDEIGTALRHYLAGSLPEEALRLVYDDVHGLWGGERIELSGTGELKTKQVTRGPGGKSGEDERTVQVSRAAVERIVRLVLELEGWLQCVPQRVPLPDESRARFLISAGDRHSDIWEWHGDLTENRRIQILREALRAAR